jgi:uncharacterized protein
MVLREVSLVFVAITAITLGINALSRVPVLGDFQNVFIGLLFLLTALRMARREPEGTVRYGIDMCGILASPVEEPEPGLLGSFREIVQVIRQALPVALRETIVALVMGLVVLPPFAFGFYFWHAPHHSFTFHPPGDFISYLISQLLMVGLPEEALFRGYFQTRLADAFPRRSRLWGREFPLIAIAIQAVLFAGLHFAVDLNPARLAVFFPGLLFGYLRAWRGGIGAAIVFHALCNLFSDVLVRGWL